MDFLAEVVTKIAQGSGFAALDIKTIIMLFIACVLLYLGIGKGFEPLLLVPIAFGMLLANLPVTGLFAEPVYDPVTHSGSVGFMWVLYQGVQYAIYPSIIFMGIGAMTDFGPLLANPMSLMLGAAAQLGIFAAFLMALVLGPITGGVISFTPADAAAIGVIGGADGPMVLFSSLMMAPELFVPISIIAYLYLSLTYGGYPYIIKLMVPKKYRGIDMYVEVPEVSQKSKFLFIIITCTVLCLLLPVAAPLLLSFFIGMAVKEAKINKYTELLEEGLSYFGTFFLGLILGVLCEASTILNPTVIIILVIGILALAISAVGGLLGGWLMYLVHKAKREDFNPTIGIAGVSCVPTTAKLAQHAAQDENPFAVILPVAMGANISGVITSAIAAGIFVTTIGMV